MTDRRYRLDRGFFLFLIRGCPADDSASAQVICYATRDADPPRERPEKSHVEKMEEHRQVSRTALERKGREISKAIKKFQDEREGLLQCGDPSEDTARRIRDLKDRIANLTRDLADIDAEILRISHESTTLIQTGDSEKGAREVRATTKAQRTKK